jgi:hypothetical protein
MQDCAGHPSYRLGIDLRIGVEVKTRENENWRLRSRTMPYNCEYGTDVRGIYVAVLIFLPYTPKQDFDSDTALRGSMSENFVRDQHFSFCYHFTL